MNAEKTIEEIDKELLSIYARGESNVYSNAFEALHALKAKPVSIFEDEYSIEGGSNPVLVRKTGDVLIGFACEDDVEAIDVLIGSTYEWRSSVSRGRLTFALNGESPIPAICCQQSDFFLRGYGKKTNVRCVWALLADRSCLMNRSWKLRANVPFPKNDRGTYEWAACTQGSFVLLPEQNFAKTFETFPILNFNP